MSISKITPSLVRRNAPYRGPRSSDTWNDTVDELITDIGSISGQWNDSLEPLLAVLPDGSVDAALDAFTYGLDGSQIYIDYDATSISDNGLYWDDTNSRPITIKETIDNLRLDVDDTFNELSTLIENSISGLTYEQRLGIGIEIFADTYSFGGVSIYQRSISNRFNIEQLATDLYGSGNYTLDGDGVAILTNSVKAMVDALLEAHSGDWDSDVALAHVITDADVDAAAGILQTKIDNSIVYDDSFAGVAATLEDDLNELRTVLKDAKGTASWTTGTSQSIEGHINSLGGSTPGSGNIHGVDIDDMDQSAALITFIGQANSDQANPVYTLPLNAISSQNVPLETAIDDIDTEIGVLQDDIATTVTSFTSLRIFTGQSDASDNLPDYSSNYYISPNADDLETAIGKLDTQLFTSSGSIGTDVSSLRTFTGQLNSGDTLPDYASQWYIETNVDSLETAVSNLDAQLYTTTSDLATHEAASNPHSINATTIGGLDMISEINGTGTSFDIVVIPVSSIIHGNLSEIGTYSHPEIDAYIDDTSHQTGYTGSLSGGPVLPPVGEHYATDIMVEDFYNEFTEGNVELVLHEINEKLDVIGVQEGAIASLTDSTGGTTDGTLAAISGSGADADINNNLSELNDKLDEILVALRNHGLIAT